MRKNDNDNLNSLISSTYDYMNRSCITVEQPLKNQTAWDLVVRPFQLTTKLSTIDKVGPGQRIELSTKDINQANVLYACSFSGSLTNLQVYIRYARNLRDTDPWLNNPDPYVKVQARQASGYVVTQSTRYIGGTTSPTWNQWLNFGCQKWRNFEMQIWGMMTTFDIWR